MYVSILKLFRKIVFYITLFMKVNWISVFKHYNSRSTNVLWLVPCFPRKIHKYFLESTFENDMALLSAFVSLKIEYRLVFGSKRIIGVKGARIYYNISKYFGDLNNGNYSSEILTIVSNISQSNFIFPTSHSCEYWENKVFMHQKFEELNINTPKTCRFSSDFNSLSIRKLRFPVLYKPAHSSSAIGIAKFDNLDSLEAHISKSNDSEFLIQEWIDIKRDLRLIYIGDELVVHYWRINQSKEWKPTSTGFGSKVDFDYLPAMWMDYLFSVYKKLNIESAAFDIAWHLDDLNSLPYILEVSPSYMPNPKPPVNYANISYSEYKLTAFETESYIKKYIDLVFELKMKLLKIYLTK
jgi:hypothetical protein